MNQKKKRVTAKKPTEAQFIPPDGEFFSEVASGTHVNLTKLEPGTVKIEDIAAHLAKICRFTGAPKRFYSVAEHCRTGLEICNQGISARIRLLWLLHDAHEFILNDINRGVKALLNAVTGGYVKKYQDFLQAKILEALGIPPETPVEHRIVKSIDNAVKEIEAAALMPDGGAGWDYGELLKTPLKIKHQIVSKIETTPPKPVTEEAAIFITLFKQLKGLANSKSTSDKYIEFPGNNHKGK